MSKEIPLSQGYFALVDDSDFERVNAHRWHAHVHRRKNGTIRVVYAERNCRRPDGRGTTQRMHRFILNVSDPAIQVDHRDHDGLSCDKRAERSEPPPQRKQQERTKRHALVQGRPKCDAFVLYWLQSEPLRRADFWEDRNGNCRIGSSLAIKLCETSDTWRRLVAPVAEYVAQALWASISRSPSTLARQRIATRLTQRNKREVKGSDVPSVKVPKPDRVCRGCGKRLQGDSVHCKKCDLQIATRRLVEVARAGRVAGHTPEAIAKEAATHHKHAQARAAWNPAKQPTWLTEQVFSEKIQPALAGASATSIAKGIGVSRWYAGRIREGYRPHPRHWLVLAELTGFSPKASPADIE